MQWCCSCCNTFYKNIHVIPIFRRYFPLLFFLAPFCSASFVNILEFSLPFIFFHFVKHSSLWKCFLFFFFITKNLLNVFGLLFLVYSSKRYNNFVVATDSKIAALLLAAENYNYYICCLFVWHSTRACKKFSCYTFRVAATQYYPHALLRLEFAAVVAIVILVL